MDITLTLNFLDGFAANHRRTCGVSNPDPSISGRSESETRFTLTCPLCGQSITGTLADADMPTLIALLKRDGQN